MQLTRTIAAPRALDDEAALSSKEIVMGLHWSPRDEDATAATAATAATSDLDAICVLCDERQRVLAVIHPGCPRDAHGSVIHTGDSETGASIWDDEQIFVFLEALPQAVTTLFFVVASAQGAHVNEVPGAACHISDRMTEDALIELDLVKLKPAVAGCVAVLHRQTTGWRLSSGLDAIKPEMLADVLSVVSAPPPS